MALSEININDFVQFKTKELIVRSDYALLRKYLLDRIAIAPVIQEISTTLEHHYITDVQSMVQELTNLACESQKERDLNEAKTDEQEEATDHILNLKYGRELAELPGKILFVEGQISQQEKTVSLLEKDLSVLKAKLDLVNTNIGSHTFQINAINIQNLCDAQGRHNIHTHSNTVVVNTYNPRRDILINERDRFNVEKQGLKIKIDSKKDQITNEKRSLSDLSQKKRQHESRNKELNHQLDEILPNKELQRKKRSQERLARKGFAPNPQQLSEENRSKLLQQINKKTAELEGTKYKLQTEAVNSSYSFFVTQLQEILEQVPTPIAINPLEQVALVSITKSMIEFIKLEKAIQETNESLNKSKAKLSDLQNQLKDSKQLLQKDEDSNKELIEDNLKRYANIERLEPEKKSATRKAVIALCCCLLGALGAAATAAIIITLIINPIFFAIVGALALMALIALPFTIYHFRQKSNLNDEIENNQERINSNSSKISRQEREAADLESIAIPNLKSELQETEKLIEQNERLLESQKVDISRLINSATNIMPSNIHVHGFFNQDTVAPPQQPFIRQTPNPNSQFGL